MKRTMKNENCMMLESFSSDDGENGLLNCVCLVVSSGPRGSVVAHMVEVDSVQKFN
jgi:hypothetical protein